MAEPERWKCDNPCCLHGDHWWVSHQGVILCAHCQPPASPTLVAREGGPEDAPFVSPHSSRMEWKPSAPASIRGSRPLWLLRARGPEKVEGGRRLRRRDVPPDVTHWCHEGDDRWTPIRCELPPEIEG